MPVPEDGMVVDSGTLWDVDVETSQLVWVAPVFVSVVCTVPEELALGDDNVSDRTTSRCSSD